MEKAIGILTAIGISLLIYFLRGIGGQDVYDDSPDEILNKDD